MSATGAAPAAADQQKAPPPTAVAPGSSRRDWTGSAVQSVLAIVAALLLGGLLIALTDDRVADAASYLFARPGDTLAAMWAAASSAYEAMFYGAVYNPNGSTFAQRVYPLAETLTVASAAPISSCPWAPMLNSPAWKAMATPSPARISGVATVRVSASG